MKYMRKSAHVDTTFVGMNICYCYANSTYKELLHTDSIMLRLYNMFDELSENMSILRF